MNLARRPALVVLALSSLAFVLLAILLVPWDWLPGGAIRHVPARDYFTTEQLQRAEDYSWSVRPLAWSALAVSLAAAMVLGLTGLGSALVGRIPRRLRVPLGVLALLVIGRLLTLPLSLLIRRQNLRYDLTRQSLGGWARDNLTGLLVTWVATTVFVGLLVWLARRAPRWWFAWFGAAAVVLTFVASFLYPVVVEPLFNKFTPMQQGPLRQSIFELADREGVPIDDVLVADASRRTTTLNAYVSGFAGTHRVVVYDNTLRALTPDQVRIIVAHELGHAKNHDVLTGTALGAVGALAGVCLLALLLDLPALRRRAGVDGPGDARVVALVLALVAIGTFLASPVENTASRAVEARADRESLEVTRDPGTFVSMQQQLALKSLADPNPPKVTQFWFGSHPTVLQRIGLARAMFGDAR